MGEIIYGTTSMKSKKIKPCPFCGGEATLRRDVRYPRPKCNPRQAWEVVCENNKCCVYDADTRYFFSAKAAILAWNDRKLGCEHEQMLADGELVSKEWHDEQIGHAELVIEEQKAELEEWEKLFDISNEREYRKKFNEEWKQEYQKKLDERGDGTIAGFPDFDLVYKLYFEQRAEIQRLKGEDKANAEAWDIKEDSYKGQLAELQKQVDKAWFEVGKMCMEERKATAEEFSKRAKALFNNGSWFTVAHNERTCEVIDEILKEIVGGQYVNTATLIELSTEKTPLTVEQLKSLPIGAWICVDALQDTKYEMAGVRYWKKTPQAKYTPDEFQCGSIGYGTAYNLKDYGATWLAYLPEKQPKNIDFSRFYELVGLPKVENS